MADKPGVPFMLRMLGGQDAVSFWQAVKPFLPLLAAGGQAIQSVGVDAAIKAIKEISGLNARFAALEARDIVHDDKLTEALDRIQKLEAAVKALQDATLMRRSTDKPQV